MNLLELATSQAQNPSLPAQLFLVNRLSLGRTYLLFASEHRWSSMQLQSNFVLPKPTTPSHRYSRSSTSPSLCTTHSSPPTPLPKGVLPSLVAAQVLDRILFCTRATCSPISLLPPDIRFSRRPASSDWSRGIPRSWCAWGSERAPAFRFRVLERAFARRLCPILPTLGEGPASRDWPAATALASALCQTHFYLRRTNEFWWTYQHKSPGTSTP